MKYSRVSHALQIYQKECKIAGIKEIDLVLAQVKQSNEKLDQVLVIIGEIKGLAEANTSSDLALIEKLKERCDKGRSLLSEVELDMEKKELDIRR